MKNSVIKSVSIVMVVSLLSRAIGFIRDILIASSFGATYYTDAYNIAVAAPDVFFLIIGLAISTTFIPILSEVFVGEGKEKMFDLSSNITNILTIISLFVFSAGMIFTPVLVKILAPSFKEEAFVLTVYLTRISLINIVFMTLNACYSAILQLLDDFIVPSLLGVVFNLPIVLYILFLNNSSIVGLTVATTVGNLLRVVFLVIALKKHGYGTKLFINLKDSRIKKMLYLIMPVMIGAGVNQLNLIVDKALASGFENGAISALNFSSRIVLFVNSILSSSLVTVLYPLLSKLGSEKKFEEFGDYLVKSMGVLLIIMLPVTALIAILNVPITTVIYKRGVFDDTAVRITSLSLLFYSLALPFYALRDIFNAALFSIKETKVTTINGIWGMAFNIIFSLVLSRYMGFSGIALAATLAAAITCLTLFYSLRVKVKDIDVKYIIINYSKVLISIGISSVVIFLLKELVLRYFNYTLGAVLSILIPTVFGIAVYLILIYVLKVKEFNDLLVMVKTKLKR